MNTQADAQRAQSDNEADEESRFSLLRYEIESGGGRIRYVVALCALLVVLALAVSFLKR
ncbi:MAG: hypothetical protein M3Y27_25790 [Acidobacteriota bacterium]|nr:hypothetical protein [Acidobacteriota bacterium]